MDPLRGSPWSAPATVAGFAQSSPNETLVRFAAAERARGGTGALDIGCGAARNTIPLAHHGWNVLAVDLSEPMIEAAAARVDREGWRIASGWRSRRWTRSRLRPAAWT
jgi:2-polyprenyl-3-methyl-5-hydroxy-6-metoxy-1,4-benzoquinol methylase